MVAIFRLNLLKSIPSTLSDNPFNDLENRETDSPVSKSNCRGAISGKSKSVSKLRNDESPSVGKSLSPVLKLKSKSLSSKPSRPAKAASFSSPSIFRSMSISSTDSDIPFNESN